MADEDDNHPRDWGHHKSPFFKLPPEIRNKIYRETFAGSKIDLIFDPPFRVKVVPVTGRRSIFSTVKSSHHFLLTCFQVYSESLAIYWSLTLVRNGCDGHFSRGYFLNRIPAIARPYIQHLRGVLVEDYRPSVAKWMQDLAIGWHLSLAESLVSFPNLKSCSILSDPWGMPFLYREAKARHPKVHFLEKTVRTIDFAARGVVGPLQKVTFQHHISGRILRWYQPRQDLPRLSDEVAFDMLMNASPDEIESTTSRLGITTSTLFAQRVELDFDLEDSL